MSRFPRARNLAIFPVLFALLPLGCSRPTDTAHADQHRVPFRDGENPAGDSDFAQPASAEKLQYDSGLPFRDSQTLPAGTLLIVRLKGPVSAGDSGSSNFDGILDAEVVVEGAAVLPRGASVAGRVESTRTSELKANRGYVRLRLDSVNVGGRDLPIRTSSLFVRGNFGEASTPQAGSLQVVRLSSGRRLTFRLSEPVFLASQPDRTAR